MFVCRNRSPECAGKPFSNQASERPPEDWPSPLVHCLASGAEGTQRWATLGARDEPRRLGGPKAERVTNHSPKLLGMPIRQRQDPVVIVAVDLEPYACVLVQEYIGPPGRSPARHFALQLLK